MEKELEAINASLDRLRHELAATNLALCSTWHQLEPEQRQSALTMMATASAHKQALFEQIPTETAQAAVQQMQQAEERMHQMLSSFPSLLKNPGGPRTAR